MNRLVLLFTWVTLVAMALLILWAIWSFTFPFQVLDMKPGSWEVKNPGKRVARGEKLQVYLDYCVLKRHDSIRLESKIEQDGRFIFLDPQFHVAPLGCRTVTAPLITIPRVISIENTTARGAGTARLLVTARYRINALREVSYSFTTDQFLIDP